MKIFGFLALIAGILLITVYPRISSEISGNVHDSGTVYFRSQGEFNPVTVSLDPKNNPLKIRLYGYFLPGGSYLESDVSFEVQIREGSHTIYSETITLSWTDTKRTPAEENRQDGSVLLSQTTGPFAVGTEGSYQISVRSVGEVDFSLSLLDAVVVENVDPPLPSLTIPGVALVIFGVILLHRERKKSRKRRRKMKQKKSIGSTKSKVDSVKEQKTEPIETPPPKRKKYRWGRQKKED